MSVIDSKKMEAIAAGVTMGAALNDTALLDVARNYKKFFASRYRLLNEGDINNLDSTSLHASLKLDGQLHFLYKKAGDIFLYNVRGRVIQGLACIKAAETALADCDDCILAGELYSDSASERSRVYSVSSALKSGEVKAQETLNFAVFDVVEWLGESYRAGVTERCTKLAELIPASGPFHHVKVQQVDKAELSKLYNEWVVNGGEEGIVCIDEEKHKVYKIKPRHNVDAVVLGFTESPDAADSLRVLLTGLMRPDGSFQVFARVGTGFDEEQRRAFYRMLKPLSVPSAYNATDRNHTLFTMVRPEVVIEMAFHDVIYEDGNGKPEMKPVLHFDARDGYSPLLPEAFVSVLGPVFKRIRDDKGVNPDDLRLTQLQDFVDLDNLEAKSRNMDLAQSSVLKREVYSKTTKGLVSVRKFLCWKTNKEALDTHYPPYVFVFVDYSPGRAAPLKRELKTAMSEQDILALFDEYREAQIKRGWVAA